MAALLYEVAWTRLLGLHLGHTTAAASTVLASYMAGLAAGSLAASRLAPDLTRSSALKLYAALETGVAAWAVLLPLLLDVLDPALRLAYGEAGGVVFAVTRVAASLVLVAVPATAMGATFPIAARWVLSDRAGAGSDLGSLYAANTVGAALGAALTGFVLLPAIGLAHTTLAGAGLSLACASAALGIARTARLAEATVPVMSLGASRARPRGAPGRRTPAAAAATLPEPRPGLAALALGVTGFVALVHEVAWTRVLAMVLGPTSAAFSAMLVAFIGGLAIGSALGVRLVRLTAQPIFWLATALAMVAAGGCAVSLALNGLPLRVAEAATSEGAGLASVVLANACLAALLLLPLTLALGAAFPLGLAVAAGPVDRAPRDAGRVYAANTVAAIAGAILAGFVFIERLGLRGTVVLAAGVAAAGAACVASAGLRRIRARLGIAAVAAGGFALVALGPRWDVELLAGGAYKYAPFLAGLDIESALQAGELLFHADGAAGTVTVRQAAGTRTLAIDGKIDASNGGDMLTQTLLGHLPLLLHQDPKAICVIGLGSGVTAGAVLRHPVTRVDVLEISPAVVEASEFFRAENGVPLADGRTRLVVGDGRTHLAFTSSAYDVVISEPSNPWMAGMAGLFTREFFEIVRRRLEPGGIFCQWAHAYDMSDADLRSIVATFISVFPRTTLWLSGDSDVLLVGADHEIEGRLPGLGARLSRAEVAGDLARVDVRDAFSLVSLYTAGAAALRGYARNAAVQTDDRLALEHTAPLALFQNEGPQNLERLLALAGESGRPPEVRRGLANATADEWWNRGRMLDQAEAHGLAFDSYRLAIGREPAHAGALEGLVRAAGAAGRTDEALEVLREVGDEHPDNVAARLALSRLLAASGSTDAAVDAARQARALAPESPEVLEQHASLCADSGDLVSLQALVKEMQVRHPDRAGTHYFAANALFMAGDYAQAARQSLAAVAADSRYARAWTVAGAAHAILGQVDEARAAFRTSLAIDPADATAWANFALLELNTGNASRAARLFAEALTVDPRQPVAREGLAEALERQGHGTRAARIRGFNSPSAGSTR